MLAAAGVALTVAGFLANGRTSRVGLKHSPNAYWAGAVACSGVGALLNDGTVPEWVAYAHIPLLLTTVGGWIHDMKAGEGR